MRTGSRNSASSFPIVVDALALAEIAFCSYYRMRGLPTPALNEKQESILSNKKGDGITQAENKFFFKGPKFDG